jgi:hypothetical protein
MRSAENYSRLAHHQLGPWKHTGQTAVARCTHTDPVRNARGKVVGHEGCPLVVVIKRQPGPPSDTEPVYHHVSMHRDRDGALVRIGDCTIGGPAAKRGDQYLAQLRKKRTPGTHNKPKERSS